MALLTKSTSKSTATVGDVVRSALVGKGSVSKDIANVAKAAAAMRIEPANSDNSLMRAVDARQSTRELSPLITEGVQVVSIDQKKVKVDPLLFGAYLDLNILPDEVEMKPVNVTFDEDGVGYVNGTALGTVNVLQLRGFTGITLGNADLWNRTPDTVLGWLIEGRAYNINRGTGSVDIDYSCTSSASSLPRNTDLHLRATAGRNFRLSLLRFQGAFRQDWDLTALTPSGDGSTPATMGYSVAAQAIPNSYQLKNVGPLASDSLWIGAKNADLWIRPYLLTKTTAPALMTAISTPGVDLAQFIMNSY